MRCPLRVARSYLGGGDCRAAVLELRDWGAVREQLRSENLLQARTSSSALRLSREVTQRLAVLTDRELEILSDSSPGSVVTFCGWQPAATTRSLETSGRT